jgi:carboxymethylenebutenolidase
MEILHDPGLEDTFLHESNLYSLLEIRDSMNGTLAQRNGWDAYVAKGDSKLGLVIIHEIWGFNDYPKLVADTVASSGYSGIAIDFFKGRSGGTLTEASAIRDSLSRENILSAISTGIDILKELGSRKFGVLGFCMGGGFALLGACNNSDISLCVDYYGSIDDINEIAKINCPILLILATQDQRITPWAFSTFLPSATKHEKRVEVQLYSGAKHGFHNKLGPYYNESAANDAWARTIEFLARESGYR